MPCLTARKPRRTDPSKQSGLKGLLRRERVSLPIGVFRSVDHDDEKVFVNRTKDQIKNAPEFDDSLINDDTYRNQLGSYYGPSGAGWRDWD